MLGNRLKSLRNERGLLQKDLSEQLNLSQEAISLYESNKREPDYATLQKLADFFNVTTDYLLGRTDIKEPVDNIIEKTDLEILNKIHDLSSKSKNELMIYLEFLGYRDLILNNNDKQKR